MCMHGAAACLVPRVHGAGVLAVLVGTGRPPYVPGSEGWWVGGSTVDNEDHAARTPPTRLSGQCIPRGGAHVR